MYLTDADWDTSVQADHVRKWVGSRLTIRLVDGSDVTGQLVYCDRGALSVAMEDRGMLIMLTSVSTIVDAYA